MSVGPGDRAGRAGAARSFRPVHDLQKGVSMRRGLLLLSSVLIALAVVPAATADKPKREPLPAPEDQPLTQCGFPVLGHIDGGEIKTVFSKAGDPVKQIEAFPGQTMTLMNLDTGKSITVVNSGSTQARAERDGSITISIMGHGPLPDEVVGEPGLWYLNGGRVVVILDAQGNLTSVTISGNVVDLCDQLAP
jgi:hypothetical protein